MVAALLLAAVSLWAAGCVYEAPLVEEHVLPIDRSVLGLWEYVPAEDEKQAAPERMLVLPYSETEYLIHYPLGKGGMYFRAYPIRVGDFTGVQLKLLGGDDGPPADGEKNLYHVAACERVADGLMVRTLNQSVVDDDLKGSAELRASFLRHQGDPVLFNEPGRFRRVRQGN
jgi:hypothetical protein